MDKNTYNQIERNNSDDARVGSNFIKLFGKANLSIPGEAETKKILKKQGKIINAIIKRYEPTKVTISDNALDKVIDLSAQKIGGDFPGKALKIIASES